MLGVERRHHKIIGPAQIVAYRRLPGDEGAPLRRGLIGTRDDVSDDAGVPAVSGFDQKIVLRLAISAALENGTLRASAQTLAASVKIFSRSLWQRAKLPNPAIAACWRRSLRIMASVSFIFLGCPHLRMPGE